MSGWKLPGSVSNTALFGLEGELVLARVSVDARHLEDLLESLATLEFPVNPQLLHQQYMVIVEFPAYASHVSEVREALESCGAELLEVCGMLSSRDTVETNVN